MIRPTHARDLKNATGISVHVLVISTLPVRTGDCRVLVSFVIDQNPAVSGLLGTLFIAWLVKGIFPAERKVVSQSF